MEMCFQFHCTLTQTKPSNLLNYVHDPLFIALGKTPPLPRLLLAGPIWLAIDDIYEVGTRAELCYGQTPQGKYITVLCIIFPEQRLLWLDYTLWGEYLPSKRTGRYWIVVDSSTKTIFASFAIFAVVGENKSTTRILYWGYYNLLLCRQQRWGQRKGFAWSTDIVFLVISGDRARRHDVQLTVIRQRHSRRPRKLCNYQRITIQRHQSRVTASTDPSFLLL